jgi:hypothetical protein
MHKVCPFCRAAALHPTRWVEHIPQKLRRMDSHEGEIKNGIAGAVRCWTAIPRSKSLIILRSSKSGTSERLKITRVLVPRFAELTQLQTFAKQKAILAKQKYFKRM